MRRSSLATYAERLAPFHLHPESKFLNGDFFDRGTTRRRHVVVTGVVLIGKEANRLEEQIVLGRYREADVVYTSTTERHAWLARQLEDLVDVMGEREVAERIGISRGSLRRLRNGQFLTPRDQPFDAIAPAVARLTAEIRLEEEERSRVLGLLTCAIERDGVTAVARRFDYDPANLAAIRSGRRKMPEGLLNTIRTMLG